MSINPVPANAHELIDRLMQDDIASIDWHGKLTTSDRTRPEDTTIVKPPQYAPDGNPAHKYLIAAATNGGVSSVILNNEGAEANKMEALFSRTTNGVLSHLVPSVSVVTPLNRTIDVHDLPHRVADATLRMSACSDVITDAMNAFSRGDYTLLAKKVPASLLFGFWDSRKTQAKHPRALSSRIMAYDVEPLFTACAYNPAIDLVEDGVCPEKPEHGSKIGIDQIPPLKAPAGVIVKGAIVRSAYLNVRNIKLMKALHPSGERDEQKTQLMQRYMTILGLLALVTTPDLNIRQGTNLVMDGKPLVTMITHFNERLDISDLVATAYQKLMTMAKEAGAELGIETVPMRAAIDAAHAVTVITQEIAAANSKSEKKEAAKAAKEAAKTAKGKGKKEKGETKEDAVDPDDQTDA